MDGHRFDAGIRTWAASRRSLLGGALVLATGWVGAGDAGAQSNRKRKKRPRPNAFGCLNVGDSCKRGAQCCSGICQGKKGRRRCKAHDTGGCAVGSQTEGCGGADVACTTSAGKPGTCATTTGNAGYCLAAGDGYPCKTDRDCQVAAGGVFGPRAACILCAESTGGTACATPDAPPTI